MAVKSLISRGDRLADPKYQLEILESGTASLRALPRFSEKLRESGLDPLRPTGIEILQINVGKLCNQACKHCHVDAGPDRTAENMDRETFEACLEILRKTDIRTVDLTGGAPEMNPHFRWFVGEVTKLGRNVIVRCNLTIILANRKYNDLPDFYKEHGVEVVSSLPYFEKTRTDRQRGEHVFDKSVEALRMLNAIGYGREGTGLKLNLVYNPAGAFLPAGQEILEAQFKKELKSRFGIEFNSLFTITNMPISRFLEYLQASGNLEAYMERLVNSYNPAAAGSVMCRNTLSVGWDGRIYDCDFNQMLEMPVLPENARTVFDFDAETLSNREIAVDQHCYGCTAGAGSSCGGETA